MKTYVKGFTLIELLIAVAIVGILTSIAIPAYTSYVKKSRRTDAQTSLMKIQLAQEKYRANNPAYGSLADLGINSTSTDENYTLRISNNTGTGYTTAAAPAGVQTGDSCGTLSIQVTNGNPVYSSSAGAPATCWGK